VPFAAGLALGEGLGEDLQTSLFLGAALMATSAGITSAVLLELGAGNRGSTRTILGAAVVDDVAALLLSVVVGIAGEGVSLTGLLAQMAIGQRASKYNAASVGRTVCPSISANPAATNASAAARARRGSSRSRTASSSSVAGFPRISSRTAR
jgi:hypothetical protein